MSKRILLVGHCGVDGPRLQREIASKFDSVEADRINSMEDLEAAVAGGADLLLVNREPIGFAPLMGVDVIRQLREEYPDQKAILVSDYEDAQEEAADAGRCPASARRTSARRSSPRPFAALGS